MNTSCSKGSHQFVNSVMESNTKAIEKMMEALTKSQEQMATLMNSLANMSANGPASGGNVKEGMQLTEDKKCPKCKCRKHSNGVVE